MEILTKTLVKSLSYNDLKRIDGLNFVSKK